MLYGTISAEDFRKELKKGGDFAVLDVRTPLEFEQGHTEGAINISHDEVPARLGELADIRDRKIFVICRSGNRSVFACDVLSRMGFTGCVNVMGGYLALEKSGN